MWWWRDNNSFHADCYVAADSNAYDCTQPNSYPDVDGGQREDRRAEWATLSIKMGTQVEWLNTSDAPHTVTSDAAGDFNSTSNITQNQTFKFTFTKAGTFPYHCNIHPYMKATITVTS